MANARPAVLVWSSLFPSPQQPLAGIFIRERMFRVGRALPLTVVAPQAWFPFQWLLRLWRPHFRPPAPRHEVQLGIEIFRPRFLSVPGVFKRFDAISMAVCALPTVKALHRAGRVDLIDAHFGYPDGCAASVVARWLRIPYTITLRGTEPRHAQQPKFRARLRRGLLSAAKVFSVSESLRRVAMAMGVPADHVRVVGNGVDAQKFKPLPMRAAREKWRLPPDARVLITVGGLVERKGFHRVIECLPALLRSHPSLHYLIVGAAGPEGDYSAALKAQIATLGLTDQVHFLGALPPDDVCAALSAADVFVLASRNEGWANVLLEAMACGLPVVATDVGGNAEVICREDLGIIVPFGDAAALSRALDRALHGHWDRAAIRRYAEENDWQTRVAILVEEFRAIHARSMNAGTGE